MQQLIERLEQKYPLTIVEVDEIPQGWVLQTEEKGKVLMQSHAAAVRSKRSFVQGVYHELQEREADRVAPIIARENGKLGITYQNRFYYLLEQVPVKREPDVKEVGSCLASFHKQTTGFYGRKRAKAPRIRGEWSKGWKRKQKEMTTARDQIALRGEDDALDFFWLQNFTYLHRLGETASQYIECLNQRDSQSSQKQCVTYGRFSPKQVMVGEKGTTLLVAPFEWLVDSRTRDIGQCIKGMTHEQGWDQEQVTTFLDGYHHHYPLHERDWLEIYGLLLWPGRFMKYMVKKVAHPLPRIEQELEHYEQMLREFPQLVKQQYGASVQSIDWLN